MIESNFKNEELYILGIAQFIEYAEYYKPKYVVLDKTNLNYQPPKVLINYINKFGIDKLFQIGVKKIFQIGNASIYDDKNNYSESILVQSFENIDDCLMYIWNNHIRLQR